MAKRNGNEPSPRGRETAAASRPLSLEERREIALVLAFHLTWLKR